MTRLLIPAEKIPVDCDRNGHPVSFVWRGRKYNVVEAVDRWRADTEWWRTRQWREHFKLLTRDGLLLVIYHDLSREGWYVQRIFD